MDIRYRVKSTLAKAAIATLKATGFYDGYWNHWRGSLFDYAQSKRLHIMPVHYYSPIPDVPALKGAERPRNSFNFDVAASAQRLGELIDRYRDELAELFAERLRGNHDYDPGNSAYSPLDAAVLYGMIRTLRPSRIIEIGSGFSTLAIAAAIRANRELDNADPPKFTCIEPYVPPYLQPPPSEVSEVLDQPLQSVPLATFNELGPGDLLFIDSSHVVSYGSDVVYECLELLPTLRPGVVVHIHDIFLPDDYPDAWLEQHRFFWNEQYLLQALLTDNPHFEIELGVHAAAKTVDLGRLPVAAGHSSVAPPAGFWMRRT